MRSVGPLDDWGRVCIGSITWGTMALWPLLCVGGEVAQALLVFALGLITFGVLGALVDVTARTFEAWEREARENTANALWWKLPRVACICGEDAISDDWGNPIPHDCPRCERHPHETRHPQWP